MFITSQKELLSIMPTARWSRPERLYGWIQEEEEVNLIPLLGQPLYEELLAAYKRLITTYGDITAMTIRADGTLCTEPADAYVTPRSEYTDEMETSPSSSSSSSEGDEEENPVVPADDMAVIGLLRLCQQIEFYKMLSHKMGLLVTSFNEGGGMNRTAASNYDPAEKDEVDRAAKDAALSAMRSIDTLLLTLERDARSTRRFTAKWKDAEYFYLRRDLLFTTARTMQEYYDLGNSREKYITLIKDIRFCQNVYVKPRIGAAFLAAIIQHALPLEESTSTVTVPEGDPEGEGSPEGNPAPFAETIDLLRQALALYVEARQNAKTRNVMSSLMADAEQSMATALHFIRENQDAYGDAVKSSPLYTAAASPARETASPPPRRTSHPDDGRDSAIFTFPRVVDPWGGG